MHSQALTELPPLESVIDSRQADSIDRAIDGAVSWLHGHQDPEGYWVGMLESNACMEAEWILAMHVMGLADDPKIAGLRRGILDEQRPDGSWETYFRAQAGDMSATVEAYAALRAAGMPQDAPPLVRARQWIFEHGGLGKVRVFTRYWLALIGEWPWEKTPNIPPEIIFFPRWFPFNIYKFACWARATILPLTLLSARRLIRPLPAAARLDELFPAGRENADYSLPRKGGPFSWERFFTLTDRLLHGCQRLGITPGRKAAIDGCLSWILARQEADGSWGGIQPPWIYSLMALHGEGYPVSHPVLEKGLGALNGYWSFARGEGLHIQACESPVWDTLLVLLALVDCGDDCRCSPAVRKAVDWVLDHEIRSRGDWQFTVPGIEPGGWAFERANTWYPDIDDTAVALVVLGRLRHSHPDRERLEAAIARASRWLIAMQCRDGGWAAFDRDNDRQLLTKIPFCDFGEVLDPPSVDVTGHVIEALGVLGMDCSHPVIRRAVTYIRGEQEPEGCWFGRWGVNYIYGTAAVLCGLAAAGEDMRAGYVLKACDWIAARQNPDGGWGESCGSYMDGALRGKGESTASQTGWAMMALLATGASRHRQAIEAGAAYLAGRQQAGTWEEPQYTGTGFPGYGVGQRIDLQAAGLGEKLCQGAELSRGFMIHYDMYRHYFPLMALARARRFLRSQDK